MELPLELMSPYRGATLFRSTFQRKEGPSIGNPERYAGRRSQDTKVVLSTPQTPNTTPNKFRRYTAQRDSPLDLPSFSESPAIRTGSPDLKEVNFLIESFDEDWQPESRASNEKVLYHALSGKRTPPDEDRPHQSSPARSRNILRQDYSPTVRRRSSSKTQCIALQRKLDRLKRKFEILARKYEVLAGKYEVLAAQLDF